MSSNIPAAETFKTTFLKFVNRSGYAREDVYNCEETSIWMINEIFTDWYKNVFTPNVKKFYKERKLSGKVLLVIDNMPTHPSVQMLNSTDKGFEVIFSGTYTKTGTIQRRLACLLRKNKDSDI